MSSVLGPSSPYKVLAEGTVTTAAGATSVVTLGKIGNKIVDFSAWPTDSGVYPVFNTGAVHQTSDDAFSAFIYAFIARRGPVTNSELQVRNHFTTTLTAGYIVREIK